jgi:predicted enzyme related to lactoylglutathione lyase
VFAVHIVSVCVRDQNRALDFYVQKLGCDLRVDRIVGPGERFVEVAPPGGGTRISLVRDRTGERVGGATGITFNADDLRAAVETLTERGVQFTERPAPRENGSIRSVFVDADGNSFVLQQHPPRAH